MSIVTFQYKKYIPFIAKQWTITNEKVQVRSSTFQRSLSKILRHIDGVVHFVLREGRRNDPLPRMNPIRP